MKISRVLIACLLILCFGFSSAAMAALDGWYVGAGIGHARADLDRTDFTPTAVKIKASDTGYKLFTGYQINPNFAIEAGFTEFGTVDVKSATTTMGTIKTKAVMLNGVGLISTSNRLSVFAKGGIYRTDRNRSSGLVFTNPKKKVKNDNGVTYSLGAQISLSEEVAFNVNFEKLISIGSSNLNMDDQLFSGNLAYYFG